MVPVGPESDADADFVRALRGCKADQSIQSDAGQYQRQHRKGTEQQEIESSLTQRPLDQLINGCDAGECLLFIDLMDLVFDSRQQAERIGVRAHEVSHRVGIANAGSVGNEDLRLRLRLQTCRARVTDDAYD